MISRRRSKPEWDLEQLEVIMAPAAMRQLVTAGPGAGKSAVACQRVAYLVDEGVAPSRILIISFTRTAVAELRDRIGRYSANGERARSVRISTIDSHAWSLRSGFGEERIPGVSPAESYEASIEQTVDLFRHRSPELREFIGDLEHLIIDEAQDVMGIRADLVIEMLHCLSTNCGVTILADPAQAIYGFTEEDDGAVPQQSLLERVEDDRLCAFTRRRLTQIHRIKDGDLVDLFLRTRKEIEAASGGEEHVAHVQQVIRDTCGFDVGVSSYPNIADFLSRTHDESMLVLFRRRADVLLASSYCSSVGVQHRLRMSNVPVVVRPWIGWLFGEYDQAIIVSDEFERLWDQRASIAPAVFNNEQKGEAWALLHRLAAGRSPSSIDLVQLCRLVARSRPPIELCYPDLGTAGPILGTIHASKGREADIVVLVMPSVNASRDDADGTDSALIFEEGRVYYVGATRARKMLVAAGSAVTRVGYLESRRVYRTLGKERVQLEIGRDGDVDDLAHLAWANASDVQRVLAELARQPAAVHARSVPEQDYAWRLIVDRQRPDGVTEQLEIGQLGSYFQSDLGKVWSRLDDDRRLKPALTIRNLQLIAVTSVAIPEEARIAAQPPFKYSGFALAPVIKGFPTVQFYPRHNARVRSH